MTRARVPHFEMCKVFKSEHESKFGGLYLITSLDAKEAHELWTLNGEIEPERMKPYCRNYFASDFAGWSDRGYPAWLFFKHFNSFAPKIEKKSNHKSNWMKVGDNPGPKILCSLCGQPHGAFERCVEVKV